MRRAHAIVALTLIVIGLGLVGVDVALAQPADSDEHGEEVAAPMIGDKGLAGVGRGVGAGLVVMGGAAGIGRIGGSAVESMARQPEAAGTINTAMLITAAMIEGATLFGVLVCLLTT